MYNKQTILAEIENVQILKMITQAYEEIAVMRMQRIRGSVLNTRKFLTRFAQVFYDVKSSYKNQIAALQKKKKRAEEKTVQQASTKPKTISVLLTPNAKLYGDISSKVFRLFIDTIKKEETDLIIIGKLGRDLFTELGPKKPYFYFELTEDHVRMEDLKPIAYNLVRYERINIYHGQFQTLVEQKPVVSNVSGDQPIEHEMSYEETQSISASSTKFLFEPTLEKILEFFETQTFTSLFKQSIHESHLSNFASRIKAMEDAISNIEGEANSLKKQHRVTKRLLENKKQQGMISGIALWSR